MDKKIKQIARMGHAAKGTVYLLTGGLAAGAAIGIAKSSEGKLGVIKFLQDQPFGNVLLVILAFGLLCYAIWRFFESIKDPENMGNDFKAVGKRIGFFVSGLIYLGLSAYSVYQIFRPTGNQQSSGKTLLPTEYLDLIFYIIASAMALKAIFQIVKAYKGTFLNKFQLQSLSNVKTRKTIKWLAYSGLISRATVAGIVSYFFFTAADTATSSNIKGTSDAFSFLRQNSEGPWLMVAVALGLMCYGLYMLILAKYRKFKN